MHKYCIVFTTFKNEEEANKVVIKALNEKLAACVQILNSRSHYVWNGKMCDEPEVLVLFKTRWALYDVLQSMIKENHSYDVPEIIAVDIKEGFSSYLEWIYFNTKNINN